MNMLVLYMTGITIINSKIKIKNYKNNYILFKKVVFSSTQNLGWNNSLFNRIKNI